MWSFAFHLNLSEISITFLIIDRFDLFFEKIALITRLTQCGFSKYDLWGHIFKSCFFIFIPQIWLIFWQNILIFASLILTFTAKVKFLNILRKLLKGIHKSQLIYIVNIIYQRQYCSCFFKYLFIIGWSSSFFQMHLKCQVISFLLSMTRFNNDKQRQYIFWEFV